MRNIIKFIVYLISILVCDFVFFYFHKDIFKDDDALYDNAYVQLMISSSNINKAEYVDRIKYLKNKYIESNVRVHIIDSEYEIDNTNIQGLNSNIGQYIEENIPNNLNKKYLYIKDKLKK